MAPGKEIVSALKALEDPVRARRSQRFFKTGPGEYGEGDLFLGISVPLIRKEVRRFRGVNNKTLELLLQSKWHEIRLFALADTQLQQEIFSIYLHNTHKVNS